MLRSGRIIYTNDLPIYTAFDEGAVRYPGALVADVPSNLNAMLLDGRLDLSPISAFATSSRSYPSCASARATRSGRSCA
jgi:chorismate dehydratase